MPWIQCFVICLIVHKFIIFLPIPVIFAAIQNRVDFKNIYKYLALLTLVELDMSQKSSLFISVLGDYDVCDLGITRVDSFSILHQLLWHFLVYLARIQVS